MSRLSNRKSVNQTTSDLLKTDNSSHNLSSNEKILSNLRHPIHRSELFNFCTYTHDEKFFENIENEYQAMPITANLKADVGKQCIIKNRFQDIYPYDFNRVILGPLFRLITKQNSENKSICDTYINSSIIQGFVVPRQYLASQGPFINTIKDFWHMIWQQNVIAIVMLNDLKDEGEAAPDYTYFPQTENESVSFGRFSISLTKTMNYPESVVRVLKVTLDESDYHVVKHFHYTKWADHAVPNSGKTLIDFRNRVHKDIMNDKQVPLVVHCRAGVGRTGTFIALDIALQQIITEPKYVDILRIVSSLRRQRICMVQTPAQYRFLYTTILEDLMTIKVKNTFSTKNFTLFINDHFNTSKEIWEPDEEIVKQFELLRITSAVYQESSYIKPETTQITKYQTVPIYEKRITIVNHAIIAKPFLTAAIYVDAHDGGERFIVSETPSFKNLHACNVFWKTVFFHDCSHIVMLNGLNETDETFLPYWPTSKSNPIVFDDLKVTLISEDIIASIINVREFDIEYVQKNKQLSYMQPFEKKNRIVQLSCALPTKLEPSNAKSMLHSIFLLYTVLLDKVQNQKVSTIMIQCLDALNRCGLFLAFTNLANKIFEDGVVDIYYSVKCIRESRPQFVGDINQYSFLHQLANVLLIARDEAAKIKVNKNDIGTLEIVKNLIVTGKLQERQLSGSQLNVSTTV